MENKLDSFVVRVQNVLGTRSRIMQLCAVCKRAAEAGLAFKQRALSRRLNY